MATYKKSMRTWWRYTVLLVTIVSLFTIAIYVLILDEQVRSQFEGKRWQVPSRVYARPLELYSGLEISVRDVVKELELLRYEKREGRKQGTYYQKGRRLFIHTRGFEFWDESAKPTLIEIKFSGKKVSAVWDINRDRELSFFRLEPLFIGGIYPKRQEDRILLRLNEAPRMLVDTLLAVEDRQFYSHFGIAPMSILRAMFANIRAGSTVQGGSTLTQQLVKNFYLSSEKTFSRKTNEAVMSLLLEYHYQKGEILEAYLNEIYLGQDGKRAIHGFGLASYFYFEVPLEALNPAQIALLIGIVKGASYYDPRRHPERALARRNLVLDVQASLGLISAKQLKEYKTQPLGVTREKPSGATRFPAFIDLVQRQLHQDYRAEDLTSEGLRLFTTLDPIVQLEMENTVATDLKQLDQRIGRKKSQIQAAAIISESGTGAIRALLGSRQARDPGFNRALDANRHIGSLIKPVVYLSALQQPEKFNLATVLEDIPIRIPTENGEFWSPENYDEIFHGRVSLINALANSYNAATVRLGMQIGLENIVKTLNALGLTREINLYPSMLLGALEMTPFEVLQIYQTISAQGFQTPLRAIHTVTTAQNIVLNKYPVQVQQSIGSEYIYLLLSALQQVMQTGTAKNVYDTFPRSFILAGKTGTTNDYRDSWFAGMSGDKVAVVWLGTDDNQSTRLTGASGALQIWKKIMRKSAQQPLSLIIPSRIQFARTQVVETNEEGVECATPVVIPVIMDTRPDNVNAVECENSLKPAAR